MKICIFTGARPNFIKVAPVIRAIIAAQKQGVSISYNLVYAGASDDITLEDTLFSDLSINRPDVFLDVTCQNLNELTGQVMSKFEVFLQQNRADAVVVVDDLASTMAAAIVTKKQGITLAHIAAGTRSFDINMPKEINRLVIDGLSDILFTAGFSNNSIANREGAELSKVYMVGNILMDNLRFNRTRFSRPAVMDELKLKEGGYMVFTLNRKALMSNRSNLRDMLKAMISAAGDVPFVAPLRDKAVETIMSLALHEGINLHNCNIIKPLGYLDFGYLTAHAIGIVTDSGNVAEEATFNGVPCITLNSYTEHIETVKIGSNELVGEDPEKLRTMTERLVNGQWKKSAIPDRWDGRSAERIVSTLLEYNKNKR